MSIMPETYAKNLMPQGLYSAEAEKAVLGCMLAQPGEVIDMATETLVKEDFFVPAHQEIFTALREMFNQQQAIDVMTVHQWLTDRKLAEPVGSPDILGELLVGFATHMNVASYIRIVKDKSQARRLQSACSQIVADIMDSPDDVDGVIERAQRMVNSIGDDLSRGQAISASECVSIFRKQQADIAAGVIEPRLATGLRCLDETNGGIPLPGYTVIAGEPGSGKSALMLQMMQFCAENGYGVGGFSAEMTVVQCMQRMVANTARMDSRQMNRPLPPEWATRREKALDHLSLLPFFIDPTSAISPRDLIAGTRKMVKSGCRLIWLDNAQLMIGSRNDATRVEQLTEVSRTIQFLQKEHGIAFILVCQITNEARKKGNIQAFDLADCAAFGRDARCVIMLEKDASPAESAAFWMAPIIVRVTKYSEGECGDFKAVFNKLEQRIQ
jgi:replicative DNA helicase